jgi:hypothetical protein
LRSSVLSDGPIDLYLSQQGVPSFGWAQQAPSFSSFVLLGVQQEVVVETGAQQEELFLLTIGVSFLLFSRTGMFAICVSMF